MASQYFRSDTIVAAATPLHAVGAIGIVRVSGPAALAAVARVLRPKSQKLWNPASGQLCVDQLETHKLFRCEFVGDGEELIDDGMFVWMRGPHSYTGEDSVELQLHGNPYIVSRLVSAISATGLARVAEAGEFSFRAFRNGKMDLSQAEAVSDLIAAKSDASMRLALSALQGVARRTIEGIQEELVTALAQVELDIDFSEQGVPQVDLQNLLSRTESIRQRMENCRERFRRSIPLREGIRTAIVGAPNSGKSTLFNQLLGEDRSIVSDIAGTTRDVVRESILFNGLLLVLADTAGIRDAQDQIEREGIARSFVEVKDAHLVVALLDGGDERQSSPAAAEALLADIRSRNPAAQTVLVLNKKDAVLESVWDSRFRALDKFGVVGLAAKTGDGLEALHAKILAAFSGAEVEEESGGITRSRHEAILQRAEAHLDSLRSRIQSGQNSPDILALDLRAAVETVGEITGQVSSDDLLNFIFSKFCIGK